jgi:hypothetical protein
VAFDDGLIDLGGVDLVHRREGEVVDGEHVATPIEAARQAVTDLGHPLLITVESDIHAGRYEQAAIDAVERCPGECIYLEPDSPQTDTADDSDIVDAEIVDI